jgi:hypothetical protein
MIRRQLQFAAGRQAQSSVSMKLIIERRVSCKYHSICSRGAVNSCGRSIYLLLSADSPSASSIYPRSIPLTVRQSATSQPVSQSVNLSDCQSVNLNVRQSVCQSPSPWPPPPAACPSNHAAISTKTRPTGLAHARSRWPSTAGRCR